MKMRHFYLPRNLFLSLLLGMFSAPVFAGCPSMPDYRYTINADGTAVDFQTKLMWQRCQAGLELSVAGTSCNGSGSNWTFTWAEALQAVTTLNNSGGYAGYTDWRLPNRNELASLRDNSCINTSTFPTSIFGWYWSSSPVVTYIDSFGGENSNRSWAVEVTGSRSSANKRDRKYNVRFVRDNTTVITD